MTLPFSCDIAYSRSPAFEGLVTIDEDTDAGDLAAGEVVDGRGGDIAGRQGRSIRRSTRRLEGRSLAR